MQRFIITTIHFLLEKQISHIKGRLSWSLCLMCCFCFVTTISSMHSHNAITMHAPSSANHKKKLSPQQQSTTTRTNANGKNHCKHVSLVYNLKLCTFSSKKACKEQFQIFWWLMWFAHRAGLAQLVERPTIAHCTKLFCQFNSGPYSPIVVYVYNDDVFRKDACASTRHGWFRWMTDESGH